MLARTPSILCEQCAICFESFHNPVNYGGLQQNQSQGIFCAKQQHFICNQDISSYCSENVFPKVFQIRENSGRIPCPVPECKAFLDSVVVMRKLDKRTRTRYQNLIKEIVLPTEPKLLKLCEVIRDVLTLSCPHCGVAIDPTPDACSAIMCLNCSSYYCNYCFACFDSKDPARDRSDAHVHVASHKTSSTGEASDAFLSVDIVKVGQRDYQQRQLSQCLKLALSSPDFLDKGSHMIALALILCDDDISMLDIDPTLIWQMSLQTLSMHGTPISSTTSLVSLGNIELKSSFRLQHSAKNNAYKGNQSGQILVNAMLSNNIVAIKQVLTSFKDELEVNYITEVPVSDSRRINYNLLTLAVTMNLDWLAVELIRLGADIFMKLPDMQGRGALYVIIELGYLSILEVIAEVYPQLDWNQSLTEEPCKYNALHTAACFDTGHIIPWLIEHGADNTKVEQEFGYTPFALSIVLGHEYTALTLFQYEIRWNQLSFDGNTSLYIACEKGLLSVVRNILMKFPDALNASLNNGQTSALHVAIKFQQSHIVRYLIDKGADINKLESDLSPLYISLFNHNISCALMLLEAGASIHCSVSFNRYPIFWAIEKGYDIFIMKYFQFYPEEINKPCGILNEGKFCPIHIAIQFHNVTTLKALLELGADVNKVDFETGSTPLMLAAMQNLTYEVQLLLSYKANLFIESNECRNALYILAEFDMSEILYDIYSRKLANINELVAHDDTGYTVLHVACVFNKPRTVQILLELGADIYQTDSRKRDALRITHEYNAMAVERLLKQYVELNPLTPRNYFHTDL